MRGAVYHQSARLAEALPAELAAERLLLRVDVPARMHRGQIYSYSNRTFELWKLRDKSLKQIVNVLSEKNVNSLRFEMRNWHTTCAFGMKRLMFVG